MRGVHTGEQVRAAEDALMGQLPGGALMARAAQGLAVECARLLGRVYGAHVVLLVGSGNNGGDALYAGAWLARRGAHVLALTTTDAPHAGGIDALTGAGGRWLRADVGGRVGDPLKVVANADFLALRDADLVVDGLVGIGATGALRGDAALLAEVVDGFDIPVVAVDVPSGVDASSGRVEGVAVRADVTVTFGAWKPGLFI